MSGSEQSICFYLLQMEDCSRDALDSVHCMLWVCWFLALHHNIFVQVHLPLDRWVIRLQHQNQSFKKRLIKKSTWNQQFYYLIYWNQSYLVLEMEILTQMLLHLIICVFLWRDMQCGVIKIFLHLIKTSDYLCNAKESTPAWEKCTYERKCQSMMTAVLMGKKRPNWLTIYHHLKDGCTDYTLPVDLPVMRASCTS